MALGEAQFKMSVPWPECESPKYHFASSCIDLAVISRLSSSSLNDHSTLPRPIIDDDNDDFEQALFELPLPQSLYGATFLQPTPSWDRRALEWTACGVDDATIVQWCSRALADGSFNAGPWIESLGDIANVRLRDVLVHWGSNDIKVRAHAVFEVAASSADVNSLASLHSTSTTCPTTASTFWRLF